MSVDRLKWLNDDRRVKILQHNGKQWRRHFLKFAPCKQFQPQSSPTQNLRQLVLPYTTVTLFFVETLAANKTYQRVCPETHANSRGLFLSSKNVILFNKNGLCHCRFRRSRVLREVWRGCVWFCVQGKMEVARQRGGSEEAPELGERGKFSKYFHHVAKRDTLLNVFRWST